MKLKSVKSVALVTLIISLTTTAVLYLVTKNGTGSSVSNADSASVAKLNHLFFGEDRNADSSNSYSFHRINSLNFDKDDNLYVVDGGNHRIMKFDRQLMENC